jgi:hypothetical protein
MTSYCGHDEARRTRDRPGASTRRATRPGIPCASTTPKGTVIDLDGVPGPHDPALGSLAVHAQAWQPLTFDEEPVRSPGDPQLLVRDPLRRDRRLPLSLIGSLPNKRDGILRAPERLPEIEIREKGDFSHPLRLVCRPHDHERRHVAVFAAEGRRALLRRRCPIFHGFELWIRLWVSC